MLLLLLGSAKHSPCKLCYQPVIYLFFPDSSCCCSFSVTTSQSPIILCTRVLQLSEFAFIVYVHPGPRIVECVIDGLNRSRTRRDQQRCNQIVFERTPPDISKFGSLLFFRLRNRTLHLSEWVFPFRSFYPIRNYYRSCTKTYTIIQHVEFTTSRGINSKFN